VPDLLPVMSILMSSSTSASTTRTGLSWPLSSCHFAGDRTQAMKVLLNVD